MELWCKNRLRRGRGIVAIGGTKWIWRIGRRAQHVVAYSENGGRLLAWASDIKGVDPEIFDRGQHKGTSDGTLTPKDVAKWIAEAAAQETRP